MIDSMWSLLPLFMPFSLLFKLCYSFIQCLDLQTINCDIVISTSISTKQKSVVNFLKINGLSGLSSDEWFFNTER